MSDSAELDAGDGEGRVRVVGTAHVSADSVEEVRETIEAERPDVVAVELDESRYRQMQGEVADDLERTADRLVDACGVEVRERLTVSPNEEPNRQTKMTRSIGPCFGSSACSRNWRPTSANKIRRRDSGPTGERGLPSRPSPSGSRRTKATSLGPRITSRLSAIRPGNRSSLDEPIGTADSAVTTISRY